MKKIITIAIVIILISFVFSTYVVDNEEDPIILSDTNENISPIAKIDAKNSAYFNENIVFDASQSKDIDGEIITYHWDFGDGNSAEGKIVKHTYYSKYDLSTEFPLFYTVVLIVKDNDNYRRATDHLIKIYPAEFTFYLKSNRLELEKSVISKEAFGSSQLLDVFKSSKLIYNLNRSIILDECVWNIALYLEKPFFTRVNEISVILFDSEGSRISSTDYNFLLDQYWKQKELILNGNINERVQFKSMEIKVLSFSILGNIHICYGGDQASYIYFNININ